MGNTRRGVIAKRATAPYVAGRQKSWLKIKCSLRQEFIILGFSDAGTGGRALASKLWQRSANGNPPKGVYVRSTSIAGVYGALNDREQAFRWLDKAYQDRDGMLAHLNYQGSLQKYRSDSRFKGLIQKLGLPN